MRGRVFEKKLRKKLLTLLELDGVNLLKRGRREFPRKTWMPGAAPAAFAGMTEMGQGQQEQKFFAELASR
jgi:hypothetical protein